MRTVEERNEDGCIGVANVNNNISSDIYTRLPMVLSGLRWVDEKYSSFSPEHINAENYYFYIVIYYPQRNKESLHFIYSEISLTYKNS